MGSWTENLYSTPESYGLSVFGEVDMEDGSIGQGFNMVVVWRTTDGSFVWGQDEGCSCPAPFEDTELRELEPVQSLAQLETVVRSAWGFRETDAVQLVGLLERLHGAGLR